MNHITRLTTENAELKATIQAANAEVTRLMAMLEGPKYTGTDTTIQAAEMSNNLRTLRQMLPV